VGLVVSEVLRFEVARRKEEEEAYSDKAEPLETIHCYLWVSHIQVVLARNDLASLLRARISYNPRSYAASSGDIRCRPCR
jgi:hypothetical protein